MEPTYVVFRRRRDLGPTERGYLRIDGPFAYPSWRQYATEATPMTFARAHAFANAYGGTVYPVGAPVESEPAPDASVDAPATFGGVPFHPSLGGWGR